MKQTYITVINIFLLENHKTFIKIHTKAQKYLNQGDDYLLFINK